MKIKELKILLKEVLIDLDYKYEEGKQGNSLMSVFSNLDQFRNGINALESSDLLKKEITNVRKSSIFTTAKDFVNLNASEGRQLNAKLEELKRIVSSVSQSIDQIGGKTEENTVSIKLPEVRDFEDLSKFSSEFHKVLNQSIVNDEIKGEVRIDSVENGSIWLDVYLGSAAAVSLIGGLTWASAVVFKKIQEGRIIQKHVESLGVKNESLKEIQVKQKEALSLMINAEANNLYNENFKNENNEQVERLKLSIKMMSDLIDKGAEIHPALNQPEKVKNLYPKMTNLKTLESKIKKIEE
ncbi:hypothetical protein H3Z83_10890 [Tenacibaculum sp. S7007]|uniref:Uncharacterized protein n=1 Tax=Tenacibaculum pelagium TaxID=2759527 RepID=A0A839ASC5_9FLAO|nr:hypothetical protein [Tenacibaculum pelagium]MBA6157024.1 hypothetical protein [Tenacibaculum pelagium]